MRRLAFASCLALLAACGSDKTQLTQIVVVVDSDLKVPSELDHVTIEVSGAISMPTADADLKTKPLPRSIGIVHEGGALGPIEVRVTGSASGTVVVERSASVYFEKGRSLLLRMPLSSSCVGMLSCGSGKTCMDGSCKGSDVSDLPDLGSGGVTGFDAGGGSVAGNGGSGGGSGDGGGMLDAGLDAAPDSSDAMTQNHLPVCTIASPNDGDTFFAGDPISFSGSCTDPDTGGTIKLLDWKSDRDGMLGVRAMFKRSDLSVGTHEISLCAADAMTAFSNCRKITLHVSALPAITASIDSVSQGVTVVSPYLSTKSIAFTGSGTGYGTLSGAWSDSLVGSFATGTTAAFATPVLGKHTVSFVVTDQKNRTARDTATFYVLLPSHSTLFDPYTTANGTLANNASARINVIAPDASGTLYVADASSKQIYTVPGNDPSSDVSVALAAPPSPDIVQDLQLDATDGLAFIATKGGYAVCDYSTNGGIDKNNCNTFQGGNLPDDDVRAIVRMHTSGADYLVVGTRKGLMRASTADGSTSGSTKLSDIVITDMVVAGDGIWVTTGGDGLYNYHPSNGMTLVHQTQDDGAPSDSLSCVAVSASGTVWVGSANGIGRFVPLPNATWTTWKTGSSPSPGLASNDVRAIAVAHPTIAGTARDVIWIGTAAGVSRFDPSVPSFTTFTTSDGLPSNSVRSIAVLPNGSIAFGTDAGLAVYAGP
ncbi:MAG TPA: hypothetical protein VHM19_10555 [Polyangiales bacterium]|nr:hypothetical protein [Polyangiales bacterium]